MRVPNRECPACNVGGRRVRMWKVIPGSKAEWNIRVWLRCARCGCKWAEKLVPSESDEKIADIVLLLAWIEQEEQRKPRNTKRGRRLGRAVPQCAQCKSTNILGGYAKPTEGGYTISMLCKDCHLTRTVRYYAESEWPHEQRWKHQPRQSRTPQTWLEDQRQRPPRRRALYGGHR